MDLNFTALAAITAIVIAGIIGAVFIGRAAFAPNASELGAEESELTLRIATVFIVVIAAVFFGVLGQLEKAVPFLSPIAAFALGGIKSRRDQSKSR